MLLHVRSIFKHGLSLFLHFNLQKRCCCGPTKYHICWYLYTGTHFAILHELTTLRLNTESRAALVYLILYNILFVILLLGYITGCL
jgi:hypothetical protein